MGIFAGWIVLSFFVGLLGSDRNIGFWGSLFISLLLSPVIGLLVTLFSKTDADTKREYLSIKLQKEQLEESKKKNNNTSTYSVSDELEKLYNLKEKGVLTEEEYNNQKATLLNNSK